MEAKRGRDGGIQKRERQNRKCSLALGVRTQGGSTHAFLLSESCAPRQTNRHRTRRSIDRPISQMALCLFKLGRPWEALRLAESALKTSCSLDAKRFQLRGLILHDLRRYGDAVKVAHTKLAMQ